MTDQHPITPPRELVRQWTEEDKGGPGWASRIATRAGQWGADQELEACCEWLDYNCPSVGAHHLRNDRRPKPPTLAEQGLTALRSTPCTEQCHYDALLAALNRLKQLEDSDD